VNERTETILVWVVICSIAVDGVISAVWLLWAFYRWAVSP
jgi:hypothetical protein